MCPRAGWPNRPLEYDGGYEAIPKIEAGVTPPRLSGRAFGGARGLGVQATHSSVRAHLLVACVAGTWGTLGRLALDWYLRFAGFNESPEQPALTFAIGSVPVWAAVAIALWTPLTLPLQRATVRRSVLLGVFAAAVGTWMLYGLFVIQMGLPSSFVQAVNVLLFFPIFFATALMMGGLIALPATVGTAVLLRVLLQAMDGGQAEQGHPLDAQENARK